MGEASTTRAVVPPRPPPPPAPPPRPCSLPPGVPPCSPRVPTPKCSRHPLSSLLSSLTSFRGLGQVRLSPLSLSLLGIPSSTPLPPDPPPRSRPRQRLHILHGFLNDVPTRFLVDCGATHSFVSRSHALLSRVSLPSDATVPLSPALRPLVTLGDGRRAPLSPSLHPGSMSIPSLPFTDSLRHLFILPSFSPSFDVVLGQDWLSRHNPIINWAARRYLFPLHKPPLSFSIDDLPIPLPAPPAPPRAPPFTLSTAALREPPPFLLSSTEAQSLWDDGSAAFFVAHILPPDPVSAPPPPSPPSPIPPCVSAVIRDFPDLLPSELPPGLPPPRFQHKINLKNPSLPPRNPGVRPLSPTELAELRRHIDDLLHRGFIVPSASAYGAPVLFARKSDGSLRLVIDYRQLNSNTHKWAFPLPRISDMLDRLLGATIFTKLDLAMAYHQIPLHPDSSPLTAFRTRYGLFEFKVLPFGLVNAPAAFQSTMSEVLGPLIDKCVLVYLDDVLVFSSSAQEHALHLRDVCSRLRRARLFLKPSKCLWGQPSVPFLGHVVSGLGAACDPSKLDTVRAWPRPRTVAEVLQFLGLCNYYRRYVPRFSLVAAPLYHLTRLSSPPEWSPACAASFAALRLLLSSPPVLALPNPSLPFHVTADAASSVGVGAVLWQYSDPSRPSHRRPIAFLSRRFSAAESVLPVHLQEGIAVVEAFKTWRHHLEGAANGVVVHTDHHSLTRLHSQPRLDRTQAGWMDVLAGIDHVVYQRGSSPHHVPADALSRRAHSDAIYALSSIALSPFTRSQATHPPDLAVVPDPVTAPALPPPPRTVPAPPPPPAPHLDDEPPAILPLLPAELLASYSGDPSLLRAARALDPNLNGGVIPPPRISRFFSRRDDGVLLYTGNALASRNVAGGLSTPAPRIVIGPSPATLRTRALDAVHSLPSAGHFGAARTYAAAARLLFWPSLARDVVAFVDSCASCQRAKHSTTRGAGVALPLPIPSAPLEALAMDWVGPLPSADGFDCILVVSCRLSKLTVFIPARTTDAAADTATRFRDSWFRRFGLPTSIVSDRDPRIVSHFWDALMRQLGVHLKLSSSSHPQTDGQSERNIQTLEILLRHWVSATQTNWLRFLPELEFAFNSSTHSATGFPPFTTLQGFLPRSPATALTSPPLLTPPSSVTVVPSAVLTLVDHLKAIHAHARDAIAASQRASAALYDGRHTPRVFKVGDLVLLSRASARHIPARALPGTAAKLELRWLGPFPVAEVRGPRTYRLSLPPTLAGINPVIDIEKLVPFTPSNPALFPNRLTTPPPPVVIHGEEEWEVEAILAKRLFRGRRLQFLVKWKGYPASDSSWEPLGNLLHARDLVRRFDPTVVFPLLNTVHLTVSSERGLPVTPSRQAQKA